MKTYKFKIRIDREIEFAGETAEDARMALINDMIANGYTVDINGGDYIDEGVEV